eukprot:3663121-Pyramimonas_sp.AAC.1
MPGAPSNRSSDAAAAAATLPTCDPDLHSRSAGRGGGARAHSVSQAARGASEATGGAEKTTAPHVHRIPGGSRGSRSARCHPAARPETKDT